MSICKATCPSVFPVPGCPCWKSGAAFVTKHCRSSVGLRTASSSMLEDLLAETRTRKEPWRWPGGPCRLPPSPRLMEAAEVSERTTNCTLCSGVQVLERIARIKMLACTSSCRLLVPAGSNVVLFRLARLGIVRNGSQIMLDQFPQYLFPNTVSL